MKYKVGDRVQVSEGAGGYSGRVGTIQPRSSIKTDGRGVPILEGENNYNPMAKNEYVIKEDATSKQPGHVFTMFQNYLKKV
jgi:hypothetical protein